MRTVSAIARREISGYFSTPTGYVFISLFVFLSAMAAFWQEKFFATNLANLDQLNRFFPYLLVFFVPAIAMSLWAEEKKQGTEDLLLTLPAADWQIVAGKYLAAVAIYTVALLFSFSHVLVLKWLGNPDPGLMLTTYFGYWLMGSALLAVAMIASLLTDNLTVAFILGALLCALLVFLDSAGTIFSGAPQRLAERLSVFEQFRDLARGVVTLNALAYFTILAAVALYVNTVLLGKRRWPSGEKTPSYGLHYSTRVLALFAILAATTILAGYSRARIDATSEKIHSLSPQTRALVQAIDPATPVFITAYLSPEVPRSYVDARNNLAGVLREISAAGGDRIQTRLVETLKYSQQAREAQERFNIRPFKVPVTEEGAQSINEIFLGLAFTCGSEEFVIPFFDRGLPPEYEVMRSIRVVSRAKRRKVGILTTPARLFGGFDFQSRRQTEDWSIITDLKKQYEVQQISPDADYPQDLDALLVALPGALAQPQVDRLHEYVKSGKSVLLLLDPLPAFNIELAASANLQPLLQTLGLNWQTDRIAWDSNNPHPQLKTLPKEFVFAGPKSFASSDPVTAGLQEVVLLYPGVLTPRTDSLNKLVPLIETTTESGATRYDDLVQRSMLGVAMNNDLPHKPDGKKRILAIRATGKVNAIVVADSDLMGEQFFELRRRGIENLNFDNVTFTLNAVDQLAGDTAFIELRKRRPRHRTLEKVEQQTKAFEAQRLKDTQQAEALAEQRLKEAQDRLTRSVREIEARSDLDEQAKQITISNLQSVENRRLQVARTSIDDEKQRQIESARADMDSAIRGIQSTIKLLAVVLPPIPAALLFVIMSIRRVRRERIGIPVDRLVTKEVGPEEAAS
jgi:ABC-2 type transport system permease protein